mgnify:CR=1 FL=1
MTDLAPDGTPADEQVYRDLPDQVVQVALAATPRPRDATAARTLAGGTILWGERFSPVLLTGALEQVWRFMDGTATLGELAMDVAEATNTEPAAVAQHVTRFALDLLNHGLAHGLVDLGAEWERWAGSEEEAGEGSGGDDVAPGTREEIREDGRRYLVTEVLLTRQEVQDLTGGEASAAELAPADSCTGRRLQLDRPATVVSLPLAGRPLAVRAADDELVAWLEGSGGPSSHRGPVVAFVTQDDTRAERTFSVYDADGVLLAPDVDRAGAQAAVRGAVLAHVEAAPPPGRHELTTNVLVRDGRAVLAPYGSLLRPRGLIRQLRRRGIAVLPTSVAHVGPDGTISVPELRSLDAPVDLDHAELPVVGLWSRGNRPGLVTDAHRVVVHLRESRPLHLASRLARLDALATIAADRPGRVAYRQDRSATAMADDIATLFG